MSETVKLIPNQDKQAKEFIRDVIEALTSGITVVDNDERYIILKRSSYTVTINKNLYGK